MTREHVRSAANGFLMLSLDLVVVASSIWLLVRGAQTASPVLIVSAIVLLLAGLLALGGYFIVNPNEAKVLVLFGEYKGTVKSNGFFWTNPFMVKKRVSLRARNLNGEKIKVNDKAGNPIQIAAVVVWQVEDTYRASFDVEHFESYVVIQSEAAVRHLAGIYPYDTFEDGAEERMTLRAGAERVSDELERELGERFARAGIRVIEARLSHLAYAPEIAEAMLRRQQATAVVAARFQIVHGAVSMVEMALHQLAERHVVSLDDERKAAMVSNLLVVLCSEHSASPVVNAGTLYP
jgi:regulator of protease activity HflC (stomatin/prohibitin superfamily)